MVGATWFKSKRLDLLFNLAVGSHESLLSLWVLEMAWFRAHCLLRSQASGCTPQGEGHTFSLAHSALWSVNRCGPRSDSSRDITHTGSAAEVPNPSCVSGYLFLGVLIFIIEKLENRKGYDA